MATIQINIANAAPFFYNLVAGDSYEIVGYQNGDKDESTDSTLNIRVSNAAGPKETISINRFDESLAGNSMNKMLANGVALAVAIDQTPNSESVEWDKSSGKAWEDAVNDAVSNGGEPGLFQEGIYYISDEDKAETEAAIDARKDKVAELKTELVADLDEACKNGQTGIRGPLGPIDCGTSSDTIGGIADAAIDPLDLPKVPKIGVVYESVTVTPVNLQVLEEIQAKFGGA